MVVVNYAERGMDVLQICDKVMAALRTLGPVELRIYGARWVACLSKLFLIVIAKPARLMEKLPLFSIPHLRVETISSGDPSYLMSAAITRGGPLSSAVWAAICQLGPKPPTEHDAAQDIVRAARSAGAWAGMPAVDEPGSLYRLSLHR